MQHLTREAKSLSERTNEAHNSSGPGGHGLLASTSATSAPTIHTRPHVAQWYVMVVLQALMHCGLLQVRIAWLPQVVYLPKVTKEAHCSEMIAYS